MPGDTNGKNDIFVFDRQTNEIVRASVTSNGSQGNDTSAYPAFSPDGSYIIFKSLASNLVASDTNGLYDIFIHNLHNGDTSRVNVSSDSTQANSNSGDFGYYAISADGIYSVFNSTASNLVPGDTNGWADCFVHNNVTGLTARINISSQAEGLVGVSCQAISADGSLITFVSSMDNIVTGDTNNKSDVFTTNNPLATPGSNQTIPFNTTIILDGSASSDPNENTPLSYAWSFNSVPEGSTATIDGSDTAYPSFITDKIGDYVISLTVTDSKGLASQPVTTTITAVNVAPVASAGTNQSAFTGNTVNLSGDQSSDANGDVVSYHWSLTSVPEGSQTTLTSTNNMTTGFVPDKAGQYTASLVVNDGLVDSEVSTVNIAVTTYQAAATEQLGTLDTSITSIPTTTFNSINSQNALTNKINAALASLDNGNYADALTKLQSDILGKTDGCAVSGAPDKNDWITTCDAQNQIYPMIIEIIGYLRHL